MHLDQQTIAVVMIVFFSSTLVIAAGLVFALRAIEAGRLWACGHVVGSAAGLALAVSAAGGAPHLGVAGAVALVVGWLLIYRGVRVYYSLPSQTGPLAMAGALVLGVTATSTGLPDGVRVLQAAVYGVLALISLATIGTLFVPGADGAASGRRWCWCPPSCNFRPSLSAPVMR
ncbi:hypothetical protein ACTMU2_12085 [Cupriavidus basilensis]